MIVCFFQSGKKTGMNVLQIFPEDGNMGRVLPKYLTEWTTNKVRKGKKRRIQCTYKVANTSLFEHLLSKYLVCIKLDLEHKILYTVPCHYHFEHV